MNSFRSQYSFVKPSHSHRRFQFCEQCQTHETNWSFKKATRRTGSKEKTESVNTNLIFRKKSDFIEKRRIFMTDLACKCAFHENPNSCFHTRNPLFNKQEILLFCDINLRVTSLISCFRKTIILFLPLTYAVLHNVSGSLDLQKPCFYEVLLRL